MSADLSGLTIGLLTLDPAFDKNVTEYTATTNNATNKITAVPVIDDAEITITVNDVEIDNESSATWESGDNDVLITVVNGDNTKEYTVTVTYLDEKTFTFSPTAFTANETDGLSGASIIVGGGTNIVINSITPDNEHITATASGTVISVNCDDDTVLTDDNLPFSIEFSGTIDGHPASGTFEITYA